MCRRNFGSYLLRPAWNARGQSNVTRRGCAHMSFQMMIRWSVRPHRMRRCSRPSARRAEQVYADQAHRPAAGQSTALRPFAAMPNSKCSKACEPVMSASAKTSAQVVDGLSRTFGSGRDRRRLSSNAPPRRTEPLCYVLDDVRLLGLAAFISQIEMIGTNFANSV